MVLTYMKFILRIDCYHYYNSTFISLSMFLSNTSSARWFLIFDAGSRWKWSSVSFSWGGKENSPWSKWKAFTKCSQRMNLPSSGLRHLVFPSTQLFRILLRIFLKLCYMDKSNNWKYTNNIPYRITVIQ